MIKFYDVEGKSLDEIQEGAYYRCFGDLKLAQILSKVQSLIVKNGYELERIVTELTADRQIDDLDDFLSRQIMPAGTYIAIKKVIKKSEVIQGHNIEPDFIVFERVGSSQNCYIIELKDGHEFDTKSSAKEHQNLHQFITKNAEPLHYFQVYSRIVGFNANSPQEIHEGFKKKIDLDQAMTGRDFCKLVEIDFQEILDIRASDREANKQQIFQDLAEIPEFKKILIESFDGESSI